ncbi:thermonuclease family protein, partial [Amylibacter sp.]|nr:thermonuclease family protein [Amylibacter sp.]
MADESIKSSSKKQYSKISILSGLITHVRDGDTIIVGSIPIRLAALDCPEKNSTKGMIASEIALKFIGQAADCKLTGAKTYDRFVAYCSIDG